MKKRGAVDTNVIIRLLTGDDPAQADVARHALADADAIYVPPVVLSEIVWVLNRSYGVSRQEIADTLEDLLASDKVETVHPMADTGIRFLAEGGDFAARTARAKLLEPS